MQTWREDRLHRQTQIGKYKIFLKKEYKQTNFKQFSHIVLQLSSFPVKTAACLQRKTENREPECA